MSSKLAKLLEIESYVDIVDLIEVILSDSVSPAVRLNEDCDYT